MLVLAPDLRPGKVDERPILRNKRFHVLAHRPECGQNPPWALFLRLPVRYLILPFNALFVSTADRSALSDSLPDFRNLAVAPRILPRGTIAGFAAVWPGAGEIPRALSAAFFLACFFWRSRAHPPAVEAPSIAGAKMKERE